MANDVKISIVRRNYNVDGLTAALNAGFIKYYDGAKPAGPDTAITTQVLLATQSLNATAAGAASSGTATFNAIAGSTVSTAGAVAWFRLFASNGTTAILDGTVGTSGCDINFNSTGFTLGSPVALSSLTVTQN